ncbi:MAG TPA: glycosyltransferase N-terminal domain-containing protein [Flavobacteriales bacterium]|nr:glycosyltransferase N-terminal domain-containing protein [Flavobacteriales bacterium]
MAAPFNAKARLWVQGRKGWRSRYSKLIQENKNKPVVWFHCASLGEFEMARPVMEKLKEVYGDKLFLLVSFFSPSGYEIQKNYKHANAVVYLPTDTPSNAGKFIEIINPILAVFVKYEIWVNYFRALKKNETKIVLMNAVFRNDQRFFKWYGGVFRKALKETDKIFVQSKASAKLLDAINVGSEVTGDTRYDRVMQVRTREKRIDDIANWVNGKFCIVGGSTWQPEEEVIEKIYDKLPNDIKWIIAPHDISENHIEKIKNLFGDKAVIHSKMKESDADKPVLIIDSIGRLAQVYSLAKVSIVGGGFTGKLHNILEPAVYGIPVLFGPYYTRFQEAVEMVDAKSAISFYDDTDIVLYIEWFYYDHVKVETVQKTQEDIFAKNKGAVEKVYSYINNTISKV